MKSLANCKPSEFLMQTNKIRKSVAKWLTATDLMSIRKRTPNLEVVSITASPEEREEVKKRNDILRAEQVKKNLSDILDAMLEKHPQETLEVLALCCFVEVEDVDNHSMSEYLCAINELIGDENVLNFFTLLMRLEQTSI